MLSGVNKYHLRYFITINYSNIKKRSKTDDQLLLRAKFLRTYLTCLSSQDFSETKEGHTTGTQINDTP
jgi:hypothetical protein